MKKVVFMLATVACVASMQAATIKWGTGAVTLPGSTTAITKTNISLYFYDENLSDPWSSKTTASGEGEATTYAVTAGSGSVAVKKGDATFTPTSTYGKDDTAYGAVILTYDSNNDGTIGVGDYYMTGTGSYKLEADLDKTVNLAMGSWTQISAPTPPTPPGPGPIPEPTSGLLLLVGGAMLALRRKQK